MTPTWRRNITRLRSARDNADLRITRDPDRCPGARPLSWHFSKRIAFARPVAVAAHPARAAECPVDGYDVLPYSAASSWRGPSAPHLPVRPILLAGPESARRLPSRSMAASGRLENSRRRGGVSPRQSTRSARRSPGARCGGDVTALTAGHFAMTSSPMRAIMLSAISP